jgi:hypothetical protein
MIREYARTINGPSLPTMTSFPANIPPMPTRAPRLERSEHVYIEPPSYAVRWEPYDAPLFLRGPDFETTKELSIAAATETLGRVLDAETTPHDRYEMRAVLHHRDDDTTTFRIMYMRTDSSQGKSTAELGIDDAVAREYMACDYIHHRYVDNPLVMTGAERPTTANALLQTAIERMEQLHINLLGFVVK